jgi:hypothetical protein
LSRQTSHRRQGDPIDSTIGRLFIHVLWAVFV